MSRSNWFEVDKKGLAALLEHRGKSFAVFELIQNAWDTKAQHVQVELYPVVGRPLVDVAVQDDDPDGFADLSHAWTLFAPSAKKTDAEKRGRFNLGEKLVLALAEEATIASTSGSVSFNASGVQRSQKRRERGTRITATLRMTREELAECLHEVKDRLIAPPGVTTTVNGEPLRCWIPLAEFDAVLPTVLADEEGALRPSRRCTRIDVYETAAGEPARIYEMGIPIVETGDRYHVNIQQKVPLNTDRDNVTPSYLRLVRTAVLNHLHSRLEPELAASTWVREALPAANDAAVKAVLEKRFGPKFAAADPTDREAENRLKGKGYTIVHGGSLTPDEWYRAKASRLIEPAGKISPTHAEETANARTLGEEELTAGMRLVRQFVVNVGPVLIGGCHVECRFGCSHFPIGVRFVESPEANVLATWRAAKPPLLTFNVTRLGRDYFDRGLRQITLELIIHELGHHFASNHLSSLYYEALCNIGSTLALLVEHDPLLLKGYRTESLQNQKETA